jgi:uncharacterized protein YlxW (UPF0749 family)
MPKSLEEEIESLKSKFKALKNKVSKLQTEVNNCKSKPTKGNVLQRGPRHGLGPSAR